jgi:serine/threonine protein kinase
MPAAAAVVILAVDAPLIATSFHNAAASRARLLQAYKHDNILPLYCSFVTGQELWMVMPYMEVRWSGSMLHACRTAGALCQQQ